MPWGSIRLRGCQSPVKVGSQSTLTHVLPRVLLMDFEFFTSEVIYNIYIVIGNNNMDTIKIKYNCNSCNN